MKLVNFARKGWDIVARRVREQGVRVTLLWVYARGVPKLTGVPMLQHSAVTPQLYVGAQYNARGYQYLLDQGFTHGVNLRIEYDDAAHGLALPHYCYLPTIDDDAPTMAHLQEGVQFIAQAIESGGKVYIHCAGGIGRAPTMAAAYLVSTGMTLDEAIAYIKRARPFIGIMPPQMDILRQFEAERSS